MSPLKELHGDLEERLANVQKAVELSDEPIYSERFYLVTKKVASLTDSFRVFIDCLWGAEEVLGIDAFESES